MKILFLKYSSLVLSFTLLLGSCKKNEVAGFDSQPTMAKVALINFANPLTGQSAAGYLLKVDGIRKYDAPLPYGTTTGYLTIANGERTISLDSSKVNTQGVTPEVSVWSVKKTLETNKYYSLIPSGDLRNPNVLFIDDDITSPNSGNAKVRFINVVPDAPSALNFFYRLASEPVSAMRPLFSSNKLYGQYTEFIQIPQGAYILEVRRADNNSVISTFSGIGALDPTVDPGLSGGAQSSTYQINFKDGKIYSLILRGYISTASAQSNSNVTISTAMNRYW